MLLVGGRRAERDRPSWNERGLERARRPIGGGINDLAHSGEPETRGGHAALTAHGRRAGFGLDGKFELFVRVFHN